MIRNLSQIKLQREQLIACIGFFDGIHLGHQLLIEKTVEIAKEKGLRSAMITFDPDPWSVIHNKSNVKHITPLKTKLKILESMGVDEVIVLNFSKEFRTLSPDDFITKVLIGLGVVELVAGSDFRFGNRGKGSIQYIQDHFKHAITTHVMEIKTKEKEKIGSTYIIQAILHGKMNLVSKLLGRDYMIAGFVIDGAKQGRRIGFPTANMDIIDEFVIPKPGVYAGHTYVKGKKYMSMINVGYNPTFNTRDQISIETHILNFNEQIYGEVIHQTFVERLRDELKFDTVDELIEQMKKDEMNTIKLLENTL